MDNNLLIYQRILENMSDGVMTLDLKGRIITFNASAADILGLKIEDVLGGNFAEIFFEYEGYDEFNQTILDAIYESNVGHTRVVTVTRDEGRVFLALTTSFLRSKEEGEEKNLGVIAVFSDVTELKNLQEAEIRLTEDVKEKHRELQDAYLKIEESNLNLNAALKKVQVVRIISTVFIIGLFLGAGFFIWKKDLIGRSRFMHAQSSTNSLQQPSDMMTITVNPRPVSSSISMPGILEPLNVVNVVCPFSGKVKEKYIRFGDRVEKGQLLLKLDTSEIETQYRDARAALIKAMQKLRELKNWEDEPEVQNARRSLTKAERALESQKRKLQESKRLYEKGIVPAGEYESEKEQFNNLELDHKAAQEALEEVIKKGSREFIDIARYEMENAKIKVEDLRKKIDQADLTAPVSGVAIRPVLSKNKSESKDLQRGVSFEQGEVIVSIGDLKGMSVKTNIDEVEIGKIEVGQEVFVSGEAFAGINLEGRVATISSQASMEGNIPKFEVTVHIEHLTPQQRKSVRLGMSADMEVVIYNKPDALMVPVSAVQQKGAERFVNIKDKETNKIRDVQVETGITTLDSVEITEGLKAGDEVVVSQEPVGKAIPSSIP